MLANPKNDLFHFLSILESMGKIDKYLQGINSPDEFIEKDDQIYFNATLTLLANIGEAFGKLSEISKNKISKTDLDGIRGLRNKIVHDYTGVDSFRIFQIIQNNLPVLKNQVCRIIIEYLKNKIIDVNEFNISKDSKYYKHINFDEL